VFNLELHNVGRILSAGIFSSILLNWMRNGSRFAQQSLKVFKGGTGKPIKQASADAFPVSPNKLRPEHQHLRIGLRDLGFRRSAAARRCEGETPWYRLAY
jgi:hypothetical protein